MNNVAAVEVVQRHQQLHKPAHHDILCEVALWGYLLARLALCEMGRKRALYSVSQNYRMLCVGWQPLHWGQRLVRATIKR
eukprot:scaffold60082_cov21-Tisochrysis_lutea.AAC.2